ncbi:unnamed protein product [Clonostachys rosea]|uniref:Uncharacterized protein n=1 Tax=Bionectria ochroleuca TaxID=29856 RepID=A0ABY6TSK9_BIOOC|nr:unnamed protein product [Clonostachys rosea]
MLAPQITTTSDIRADPNLGYRVRVLLHDFLNVTKDPNALRRINSTTDEHYISSPYFTESQAAVIKSAIVDFDVGTTTETPNDEGAAEEADDYKLYVLSQKGGRAAMHDLADLIT